jgi:hypothetical protein
MPLDRGSKQAVVSGSIETPVDDWKKNGSVGTIQPLTKGKTVTQADAIALGTTGKSRHTTSRSQYAT